MRVGHLVDQMCLANSWFFYRIFTNPAPNLSHAVFCNIQVNSDLFPHPRVQSRATSTRVRELIARRISSRVASGIAERLSVREWNRFLSNHRPDILHAQDGKQTVQWLSLIESTELPLIVTFHGSDINCATYDEAYLKKLIRLFQRSTKLHFVSKALRDRAIDLGAPPEKCKVIYLGTPVGEQSIHSHRTDDCVFGIAANLVPCKGHETLLAAFAQVSKQLLAPRLCIWGDGPLRHHLQWTTQHLGLSKNVEFYGQLAYSELQNQIRTQTDVVLLPSQKDDGGSEEGLPMSLCEAASAAVPCIATDCGGIAELISHEHTGLLMTQGAVSELADAMIRLATAPAERRKLGIAARKKVLTQMNLDRQLEHISRIYSEVSSINTANNL